MLKNSKINFTSLFFLIFNIFNRSVNCADSKLTKEETISLTRDHLGRENPDELLHGFIPVWAIVIYIIAATFLVTAILSGFCYLIGCRNPQNKNKKFRTLTENY